MEAIGADLAGNPIYMGSEVVWGAKGSLRRGHVSGYDPAAYFCIQVTTTMLPKAERHGHGGWVRAEHLAVINPPPV